MLSNNGGTVGTVCGYGTFNIQNGTVNVALNTSIINVGTGGGNSTTNSTSTNSTSPSSTANITFSGGASISTLSVNSSTTVLYLNGGFVEKIVLLSAVRSTTIVITNPNSSFGELHSMFDIDTLNILTSSSSNVVMMGALYVGGCASIFCRNVIFRSQAQPFLTIVAPPQITNISNVSLIITASQLTVSNVPVVLVRADIGLLLLNLTSVSIVASNSNSIVHLANVQIGQLQISFDDMIINGTNTMLFLADGPRTLIGASGATSSSSSLLQLTSVKITIEGVQLGSNTEQYAVISLVDGSFRNMSIGMTKCNVTVTSLRSVLYVGGNMQDGYIAFTFSTIVYPHTLLIIQSNTSENSNIDNLHSYGVENVSFIASNMTLTSSSASSNPSLLWCSGATIRNSSVVLSNNDLQFGLETSVVAFHDDASLLGSSIQLQGFTASQMNTSVVSLGGNVTDSTLVVVCAEIQTAFTSILAFDGVSTRTRIELHSVAIHRSSNFVSLINISHASSTSNTIRLIHTSAKVPVLIACAAGAAGVSNGIMTACSSVGTTPMSEGSFFPELVPLVSVNRGVCDVALHPSCWKTVTQSTTSSESPSAFISPTITAAPSAATFSLNNSFTHTSSASRSISLTDTISQSTTPSASLAQTHSSSHSSSRTESVSSSTTQTRLPTTSVTSNFSATTSHTVSLSPTVSPSKSKTPSATRDSHSQSSATVQISLTATPKYCACLGDMNNYGNVVLTDANSSLLVGNTSSLMGNQTFEFNSFALLLPQTTNFTTANHVTLNTFVTTAPVSRLTMWDSGARAWAAEPRTQRCRFRS